MKRLFVLVNIQGKKAKDSLTKQVRYFESKMDAKAVRDFLNDEEGKVVWHVSRGPENLKSSKPHSRTVSGLPKYQRGNRGYSHWA